MKLKPATFENFANSAFRKGNCQNQDNPFPSNFSFFQFEILEENLEIPEWETG